MKKLSRHSRFAIVDVETTGLGVEHDRVIEIGIVVVEKGKVIETFTSLVNPERSVPSYILDFTGIAPEELENAPTFFSLRHKVSELLSGAIFVAHNARFDYSFISSEFRRIGLSFKAQTLCSVQLSRHIFPHHKHHNLDEVAKRCGIVIERRHRALDDAKAIWSFFEFIKNKYNEKALNEALATVGKEPRTPPLLKKDVFDSLPETPGVYIFRGVGGEPLYIGKSVNIKSRVMGHFYNSMTSSKDMKLYQQVKDIESIETAGELGALILEADLIKRHFPLYNRMLRRVRKLTALYRTQSPEGYLGTEIRHFDEVDPAQVDSILGIFKSKKKAQEHLIHLGAEFSLCRKLLGIETAKYECFLYQLDKCKGACVKKETSEKYNMRFLEAFEKSRLRRWPFKNAILIEEKDTTGSFGEIFVIDQWCIVASGRYEGEMVRLEKKSMKFDYDVYKIMARHLLKKNIMRKKEGIKLVTPEELNKLLHYAII